MPVTFTTAIDKTVSTSSHSTAHSTTNSILLNLLAGISSHSGINGSVSNTIVTLGESINSHSGMISSATSRTGLNYSGRKPSASYSTVLSDKVDVLLNLFANTTSHTTPLSASPARSGIGFESRNSEDSFAMPSATDSVALISLIVNPESHSSNSISFAYNERTSLEVVDFEITWDDDQSLWYTNWFQEAKILGDEDTLAIRSLVVDGAKEPCATIVVEYDGNGDGTPDEFSDPIELGQEQEVKTVSGVPVDTEGWYRFRIMEYSGYNSIYNLNMAIVH